MHCKLNLSRMQSGAHRPQCYQMSIPNDSDLVVRGPCLRVHQKAPGFWARCAQSESSLDSRHTYQDPDSESSTTIDKAEQTMVCC